MEVSEVRDTRWTIAGLEGKTDCTTSGAYTTYFPDPVQAFAAVLFNLISNLILWRKTRTWTRTCVLLICCEVILIHSGLYFYFCCIFSNLVCMLQVGPTDEEQTACTMCLKSQPSDTSGEGLTTSTPKCGLKVVPLSGTCCRAAPSNPSLLQCCNIKAGAANISQLTLRCAEHRTSHLFLKLGLINHSMSKSQFEWVEFSNSKGCNLNYIINVSIVCRNWKF